MKTDLRASADGDIDDLAANADLLRRFWAPRVPPHIIRRLYETDALGIVDQEQIDAVGYALYARCRSILRATDAHNGRATCPRCERTIPRCDRTIRTQPQDAYVRCRACDWRVRAEDYLHSYQHKQLVGGGALPVFRAFAEQFERCHTPREKMLAIDRLLHDFHGSVVAPGRPAAKNLIDLRTTGDVLAFLDRLTYGPTSTEGLREAKKAWDRLIPSKASKRHARLITPEPPPVQRP